MKGIIRTGDTHTGGGKVLRGSSNMKFGGIGVARLGDPVSCPIKGHGPTVIAEGHPTLAIMVYRLRSMATVVLVVVYCCRACHKPGCANDACRFKTYSPACPTASSTGVVGLVAVFAVLAGSGHLLGHYEQ